VLLLRGKSKERDLCTLANVRQVEEGIRRIEQYLSTRIDPFIKSLESLPREPGVTRTEIDHINQQSHKTGTYESVTHLSRYRYHRPGLCVIWERRDKTYQTWRQIAFELIIGGFRVEFGSALHTPISGCPGVTFNIRIRNVISGTSEIVSACKDGNVGLIRDLLCRGQARPNDMTGEKHPLLWVKVSNNFKVLAVLMNPCQHAIRSGSVETVQCLLDFGGDATVLSGWKNA
jgi:hypothetical protein